MIDILSQVSILQQFKEITTFGVLVFIRVFAFIVMAPPTSHKSIPSMVKVSFAVFMTILMLPSLKEPEVIPENQEFIFLILTNALIGLLLGWICILIIEISRIAGDMINNQMGLQAANLFDPGSQTQTTIFGKFFDYMALTIFLSVGGTEKVLEGLYKSFTTFPIVLTTININVMKIIQATQDVISMGFLIVSPVVMILLGMDLVLGLISRAAPQINAFQISFTIKPAVGLILLFLILPALLSIIAGLCENPFRFMY